MPVYEFQCRACEARFDVLRPIGDIPETPPCPQGHTDTLRLLSLIAAPRRGEGASAGGGGCGCGGACACSHN